MKLLLLGFFSIASFLTFSQDLQTVQHSLAINDYLSAKKQIDSFFSIDKRNSDNADAWFYKGKIYAEVTRQHQGFNYQLLQEAFNAYKRYLELDPRAKLMQVNNHVDLFQLYDLSYSKGNDYYNEQSYALAFNFYKIALESQEYIYKKGLSFQGKSFPAMDTLLINLVGTSAYLSNREEEAIPYFERLANARIRSEDGKAVYSFLYQYYARKNDPYKAARFLNSGKEFFPDDDYWIKMEMGNLVNVKDRFNRYEQLVQKYPSNFVLLMNYVVELFNYVYADAKPSDFSARQDKLQALLIKALNADPNSAQANFVMSQHIYNQVYDMEEVLPTMKEDTPAEQAKKKTFVSKLDQKYEDLLTYSLKAFDLYSSNLKPEVKSNCKKLLNQVIACYQRKKQGEKVNYYKEKLKDL